jgi:hypothetical protein
MAGQSSNLGASSSMRKKEGKRKESATRAEKAKKPNVTARLSGSSVPVVPSNRPTSHAMVVAFPMAGVNGAALLWSTAAALGAASGAAALALPAATGANGPAATATAPGAASIVTAAAAPPASRFDNGVTVPLELLRAAGGRDVPLPIRFVGYEVELPSVGGAPAPAVGIPLAAALDKINGACSGR